MSQFKAVLMILGKGGKIITRHMVNWKQILAAINPRHNINACHVITDKIWKNMINTWKKSQWKEAKLLLLRNYVMFELSRNSKFVRGNIILAYTVIL